MTPQGICKDLYSQVRPALKNKGLDLAGKKKLACRYVSFMSDIKSGIKRRDVLRDQYRDILTLIGGKS